MPTRILVDGPAPYEVVVGVDLHAELPGLLGDGGQLAVIYPRSLAARAATLAAQLPDRKVHLLEVPDGEAAKELSVAGSVWDALGRAAFTRSDAIVGLGGGAVTDLAGFVAAAWLRGVPVVLLPTTLLGMVDAALGGKTGINTAAGKNLVGAFHPPRGVLCDLPVLASLPRADYVSGLAEVVKAGFIADPAILELVEADPVGAGTPGGPATRELIERSVRVKAAVVAADPTERGGREMLNYGHTLGHAIEVVENFRWRHGEAVGVGLCFAATLGRLAAGLPAATAERHRNILAAVGLPTSYRAAAWPELAAAMRVDKKARGNRLRFVVLSELGRPRILDDPDPALLTAAYAEVGR